jgi:phosphohistidine phosphatase
MEMILWRHADAEPGIRDEERKLTAKGRKQAKRVAAWMRKRLPRDVVVLASPARRAVQTAEALTDRFETLTQLGTRASARDLLEVAGWPEREGTVIVVSHQPTLGRAAAFVLTGTYADWSFRKGSIWWLASQDEDEGRKSVVRAVIAPDLL